MLKNRIVAITLLAAVSLAGAAAGHAQEQASPQQPAIEAPAIETPATETPATETPAASAPIAQPAEAQASPTGENSAPIAVDPTVGPTAPLGAMPVDGAPALAAPQPAAKAPASLNLPHNLSPWGMFMSADIVVKAVMIGLALASLITWTVWLAKSLELAAARVTARRALRAIMAARSLADAGRALDGRRDTGAMLVRAAQQEVDLSLAALDYAGGDGLKDRIGSRLSRLEAMAGRRMSRGTGVLATIGSTAPFVGLFGTVWGIMNAFIGISEAQTTNLAIVAPGIAEALLATAVGLVAAIPAVVVYNVFARSITGYRQLLADASAGVERLVSRDLDFRTVRPKALAAE